MTLLSIGSNWHAATSASSAHPGQPHIHYWGVTMAQRYGALVQILSSSTVDFSAQTCACSGYRVQLSPGQLCSWDRLVPLSWAAMSAEHGDDDKNGQGCTL